MTERAPGRPDLAALSELAASFARAYPSLATRLAAPSGDPDVERLLEAFTELTERVHRTLDRDASNAAHFFAELVMPELARSFPCATVVELTATRPERCTVAAGWEIESKPIAGVRCRFRAASPFVVVPWHALDARVVWSANRGQELVVKLRSIAHGAPLHSLFPLRLHLAGEPRVARSLLLFLREHVAVGELVVPTQPALRVPLARPAACGLASHEPLLPIEPDEQPGFRLVREYSVLPSKLAFVELSPVHDDSAALVDECELRFRFDVPWPSALAVGRENVRLNCVPVANVFETTADPVRPTLERPQQAVRPAGLAPGLGDVYSVQRVLAREVDRPGLRRVPSRAEFEATRDGPHFHVVSRTSTGTVLAVGSDGEVVPELEYLSIELYATNAGLPGALGVGELRAATPLGEARNLTTVTPHRAPADGRAYRWRALAASALQAAPLARAESLRTLLQILNLHPLEDAQAARAHEKRLLGIHRVGSRTAAPLIVAAPRPEAPFGTQYAGHDVDLELHDDAFDDEGECYAFASVLAALYAHRAPLNTFVRTTVRFMASGRIVHFPARHGDHALEAR